MGGSSWLEYRDSLIDGYVLIGDIDRDGLEYMDLRIGTCVVIWRVTDPGDRYGVRSL